MERYAVLVIWKDGEEEYLKQGTNPGNRPVLFNKTEAEEMRDFMLQGISDEVQSVNVVLAPRNMSGEVSYLLPDESISK